MQAVVLVGGLGTRLRPLTLTTPKPLVPLVNRQLLAHLLLWLEQAGVDEVILATQYGASAFEPFLRRWRGVTVRAVEESFPLGTAGAVRNVRHMLHGPTVIVNGDNLTDLDLRALAQRHAATGADATIVVDEVADPTGKGVVVADQAGRVSHFQEKPAPGTALGRTINAGTYLIDPAILDRLPPMTPAMWETDLFPRLIVDGARLYTALLPQHWTDVGTPAGYLAAQRLVLGGLLGSPPGHLTAPGIWQEDNVNLDADAAVIAPISFGFGANIAADSSLTGPLSIGRETHILPGATVHGGAIWDGTMVEAGAVLIDTVVGYNCYIGAGVYLRDAILGDGCVLRTGATPEPGARLAPSTTL